MYLGQNNFTIYLEIYLTFKDVLDDIERFIEDVHNKKKTHSALGYPSPV